MKRFTETEKWSDPWFRRLCHTLKIGYLYLLDRVDNAGVVDLDADLANFQIGIDVDWDRLRREMGERLDVLPSGKWHLTRFVGFQFGELSESCKPHAQVIKLLKSHEIQRVSKGYPKGMDTLMDKDKDKDKDQDKEKDQPAKARFTPPEPAEVEAYSREIGYPLNGQAWCDSYAQKGWLVGKSKMKDWKAAVRNWKSNGWKPNATPDNNRYDPPLRIIG
jgi:hypothetical protein